MRALAERRLALLGDPTLWTDAAIRARRVAGSTESARNSGYPEWLIRAIVSVGTAVFRLRRMALRIGGR